ncbi:uncharacterized protein BO80DRAFT_230930 [Aspergillus ibericus CBS 121593]|uniref:Uncharacterized protein n=1 Tax=Aspergillus ibericus CBS 121593 TaxID=1448316 RepID=A0A395GLG5_9EURO|nr:hypothetical protein BO80DRAFT_230930 [Aspergillus ibericus CBS 121593]RAK96345.1 hypothetical protein BO80DRAFT_230930 [Aspergillus ibericus CBS 121593]
MAPLRRSTVSVGLGRCLQAEQAEGRQVTKGRGDAGTTWSHPVSHLCYRSSRVTLNQVERCQRRAQREKGRMEMPQNSGASAESDAQNFLPFHFPLNLPGQRLGLAQIGSDFFLFGLFLRSFPLSSSLLLSSFLFHPLPTHPPFRLFIAIFISLITLLRPQLIFCQAFTSAC